MAKPLSELVNAIGRAEAASALVAVPVGQAIFYLATTRPESSDIFQLYDLEADLTGAAAGYVAACIVHAIKLKRKQKSHKVEY